MYIDVINAHSIKGVQSFGEAKPPLVSIIITNYNYADFLEECINSCLNQDYKNIEVLLVDDASSDNSKDVYLKFANKIQILEHQNNSGQLAAFFTGLEYAKGEFITFVDADDFLDKDAISAHLYLHIFEMPQVGFTCLRNRQVSKNSAVISDFHMDFMNNGQEVAYIAPRVIHTPTWSWSTTSAMMFRADLLRIIQTNKTDDFRVCADYYVVHFANLLGGSLLFNRSKANYRRHGKNSFSQNFVIGGHRPTGHDKYHAHPSQKSLQLVMLDKLINERSKYEPYYPSIQRYAEAICYVAPIEFILQNFKLDEDLLVAVKEKQKDIKKLKNEQISVKKWGVLLYSLKNKIKTIYAIRDNLLNIYGIRRNDK